MGLFPSAFTKSALKKSLKKGYITVNGVVASSATIINGGDYICLSQPEAILPKKKLIFPLKVLFEDDYLAVIHKPPGIMVSGNSFKTVANALQQNLNRSNLPDACTPKPVHRLDFATTGILLIGKTSTSIRELNKMFENKEIRKTYFAITMGTMESHGKITSEIDGKEAQSSYEVCTSVFSSRFAMLNLVKLNPETGRRHQLRKHLSSLGNPILGDNQYGIENLILKGKGLYLHAYSLEFNHPYLEKDLYFKDEIPTRFQKIFPEVSIKI